MRTKVSLPLCRKRTNAHKIHTLPQHHISIHPSGLFPAPSRGKRGGGKKGKSTPEPDPEPEPEVPPGTPPPEPGSEGWEYVDQPLDVVRTLLICSNSIVGGWARRRNVEEMCSAWSLAHPVCLQDLAGILSNQWEEVEKAYVHNSKNVFHNLREERENIIRYLFKIR